MEDGIDAAEDEIDGADTDNGDRGLARERTDLAWSRSRLAVFVAVAVLLRRLWPLGGFRPAIVLAVITVAAVAWLLALRRIKRTRPATDDVVLDAAHLAMLTVGTIALATAGFLIGLFFPA